MNGDEASVGADLPVGMVGTARRVPAMATGFIGPDGRLQECTVLETGRKRADREARDRA
jgi:hypothetical protein